MNFFQGNSMDTEQESNSLIALQAKVANRFLVLLFLLTIPLLVVSLLRIINMGWLPVMALHIGLTLAIGISAWQRKFLPTELKAVILIGFFFALGIGTMISSQDIKIASSDLLISIILSMLFFGRNNTTAYILFIAIIELMIEYQIQSGGISVNGGFFIIGNLILALISITIFDYMLVELSKNVDLLQQKNQQFDHQRALLEDQAYIDVLTEIPNRWRYDEKLEEEWSRAVRSRTPLSFALMDIDYFKPYNDNYGHARGDETLKAVAQAIYHEITRSGDFCARYGGEEFVVLMPSTDAMGGAKVVQLVQQAISNL